MSKFKSLIGETFGRLLVVERVENKIYLSGRSFVQYKCLCNCGNIVFVLGNTLKAGKTKSCGCLRKETSRGHPTHGKTNTRLFKIWSSMKERCYLKNHVGYKNYGARGIFVCDEWIGKTGFQKFYDWSINNGYKENLSIDRIDNNKGYFPENCRWATRSEQQRNRRDSIIIEYNGEKRSLADWSQMLCGNPTDAQRAYQRYKKGVPIEKLFLPPKTRKASKQSGIKGIIWSDEYSWWIVKGTKNGKKDVFIKTFKELKNAIEFKKEYDLDTFGED